MPYLRKMQVITLGVAESRSKNSEIFRKVTNLALIETVPGL